MSVFYAYLNRDTRLNTHLSQAQFEAQAGRVLLDVTGVQWEDDVIYWDGLSGPLLPNEGDSPFYGVSGRVDGNKAFFHFFAPYGSLPENEMLIKYSAATQYTLVYPLDGFGEKYKWLRSFIEGDKTYDAVFFNSGGINYHNFGIPTAVQICALKPKPLPSFWTNNTLTFEFPDFV